MRKISIALALLCAALLTSSSHAGPTSGGPGTCDWTAGACPATSGGGLASTDIDTSAELRAILTDESGSGAAVFGTGPTITGASVNGVTIAAAKITGDQTFSSATPANVTGLSFAVTNGHYYRVSCQFIYQSDTTTIGIALGATTPTFTRYAGTVTIMIGADGASGASQGVLNSSGDMVIGTTLPGGAINTDFGADLNAILVPSADGTFQVQAATETGTTNVIVRQGSMCFMWDVS